MFFDIIALLVLTIPIIYPLVDALGFNLIWYSVIMVRIIEIGMITPPFGINLFILSGVIKEPLGTLYKGVLPFVIADFCHVALLVAIPQITLLLPSMM
jgi:TRAP-type C4-dicarboxylate transport system permease large subunit